MSEATARASRRTIRRAVGDVAAEALTEQSALTQQHDRLLGQQSLTLQSLALASSTHHRRLSVLEGHQEAWAQGGWRVRLRWLFTGRVA